MISKKRDFFTLTKEKKILKEGSITVFNYSLTCGLIIPPIKFSNFAAIEERDFGVPEKTWAFTHRV